MVLDTIEDIFDLLDEVISRRKLLPELATEAFERINRQTIQYLGQLRVEIAKDDLSTEDLEKAINTFNCVLQNNSSVLDEATRKQIQLFTVLLKINNNPIIENI